jgi:hypothetical protein
MVYLAGLMHLAMAAFFGVHAVRTGRPSWWLFILISAPLFGSIIYFFAEFLPSQRDSRGARRAMRAVQTFIDPERAVREAELDYERTPSVANRAQLARALQAKGRHTDALAHLRACAEGPYANDRAMLTSLAQAALDAGEPAAARDALQRLFAAHADARTADAELLHARALDGVRDPGAGAAFDAAVKRLDTVEAHCRYGDHLAAAGRTDAARLQYEAVLAAARVAPEHARELNREWIARANTALAALNPA